MALAIAAGVPPQHGIYTAIIGGAVIGLLGGSRVQVSGPTAAFVAVLAPISAKFGLAGLAIATALAGGLLVTLGVARLGRLIEFVPYPVTTGFTAGIAVVIATLQIPDFLGLELVATPSNYLERVAILARSFTAAHWPDFTLGLLTLAALLVIPRVLRRLPAALVALPAAALIGAVLAQAGAAPETIGTRFGAIPAGPPPLAWPWALPGPGGAPLHVTLDVVRELVPAALAIAMLGAIESLLSAVVAAGMSRTDHHPDGELIAQGVGNLLTPWFGGIAATGAIARTATNIRYGGRTPIAAVTHAVFLLLAVMALAPLLAYLPMASMAALLLVVAWNMSDARHLVYMLRVAPRGDNAVLLSCFALTVLFDMTLAVSVGIVFAAILFMGRMAAVTGTRLVSEPHGLLPSLPPNVLVYEIAGPLFFGAAQRAMSVLRRVDRQISVVLLDLRGVPTMDATGLVNLESALQWLHAGGTYTVLAGVQAQPLHLMARAGWRHREWLSVYRSFEHGVEHARSLGHLLRPGEA